MRSEVHCFVEDDIIAGSDIDEDLIPYFKCGICGGRCCKDVYDRVLGCCIDCLDKRPKKERGRMSVFT